jgi:hypothetical protein
MDRPTLRTFSAAVLLLVAACVAPTPPSASPSTSLVPTPLAPTTLPTELSTTSPLPTEVVPVEILRVDGTVLPIASRDGAPGLISCSGLGPFRFEVLRGPFGAERLVGPEYDVLRETIAKYRDDPEFGFARVTFTVAYRDDSTVVFIGGVGLPEAYYANVIVERDAAGWRWGGMGGGCLLIGAPGRGWDEVLWDLDPSFKEPTASTRNVHLLVRELECAADVAIAGRLSPAWVFLEQGRVRIQVFARSVKPRGSCDGIDPTPVTVVLPEPLGPRDLKDVADHNPCLGCGG